MPIYEFKCPNCEEVTTEMRLIAERDNEAKCPKCQTVMTRILFGSTLNFSLSPAFKRNITSFDYKARGPKKK